MSTEKISPEKKKYCVDRLEPCVFRGSKQCVKCGFHRTPAFAVGNLKSAALAVQI
jgi:hypothetical protein